MLRAPDLYSGERVRGTGLAEYSEVCERCGLRLGKRSKGQRKSRLCIDCVGDPLFNEGKTQWGSGQSAPTGFLSATADARRIIVLMASWNVNLVICTRVSRSHRKGPL